MVELVLELYFSALYVEEDPEWVVERGERALEAKEENFKSCSRSDKAERAPRPELKLRSESRREKSFSNSRREKSFSNSRLLEKSLSKLRSNSRSRVERAPSPERLA